MAINQKQPFTEVTTTSPQADFAIGFEYYENVDALNPFINGKPASTEGYTTTLINPTTLRFSPTVPSGVTVRIERETDIDESKYKFSAGAIPSPANIDANFEQIRNSQQEVHAAFDYLENNVNSVLQDAIEATDRANEQADRAEQAADDVRDILLGKIHDRNMETWSGRTQEEKNKDFYHSRDFGLVPNSPTDQFSKMQAFLTTQGHLTLEAGKYYMGIAPTDIYMQSNTTLEAYGATLDYTDSANTSNGRIRVDGSVVLNTTTLAEDALVGTNTIRVTNPALFKKNTAIYLKSEQVWSSDCKCAEILWVHNIVGDVLYVSSDLQITYLAAQTTVELHDVRYNTHIYGLGMFGSGKIADVGGKVDRAFHYNHVANCSINNVAVANFDRMGIMMGNAYNSFVNKSTVALTKIDVGKNYIQYGIALFDAIQGGAVDDCILSQGRHGISYTTSSGYGYSVDHECRRNIIHDTHASGIATHKTNANGFLRHNKINNCWGGIDCRISNMVMESNTIINPTNYGYVLRGTPSNLKISGTSVVTNSFNAIYTSELEGNITGWDIKDLEIRTSRNSGMSIIIPDGVTLNGVKIAHVHIDAAAGEGIAISGGSNIYITDLNTTNQPSNRYAVRLLGVNTAVISDSVTDGRPSRMETYGAINCINIRVVGNRFTGAYVAASIASGNAVGSFTAGNHRMDVSRSKNIVSGTLDVSEGLGYTTVFVSGSGTDTCSNITTVVPTGEIVTINKAGTGTLKFVSGGNITLKGADITLTSNTTTVRFLFNGTGWLEM